MYKKYNKMVKTSGGQLINSIAGGAYTLASICIALAAGTGVAIGYSARSLTKPHKQDKNIIQLQQRNIELNKDLERSRVLLQNSELQQDIKAQNNPRSLRF